MLKKKKKETVFKSEKSKKRTLRQRNPYYKDFAREIGVKRSISTYQRNLPQTVTVIAPNVFSILYNTTDTLDFFTEFQDQIQKFRNIYLDMSKINVLGEDAILYLLSRLDYYKKVQPGWHTSGNFPKDEKCEKLLLDSGFTKYVYTQRKHTTEPGIIYPIKSGFTSDGKIIGEVLNFISGKIRLKADCSFDIYGPMLECLTNTKNHAYHNPKIFDRWWLIAIPDEKQKKVHYTALDNGRGIPTTIKKNFKEKIISLTANSDCELIVSALQGDFRTRTEKRERGKGLPSIFEATNNHQIKNLTIISNNGYVLTGQNKTIKKQEKLDKKFHGTLISWDFVE